MESRDWRFETNANKKRAQSRQKPERMDKGFIGSQGPKGTVVLEEKLYIYIYNFSSRTIYMGESIGELPPKNLPRMQCARAIPVTWLGSGSSKAEY